MKLHHNYYVYILECADGSYYVGVTNDLDRRLAEHESGAATSCYTYKRRPVIVRHIALYNDIKQAIAREKQLKGWSRPKKEALMREDWGALRQWARSTKPAEVYYRSG